MLQSVFKPVVIRNFPKAIVLLFVALLFACGSSATSEPAPTSAPAAKASSQAQSKAQDKQAEKDRGVPTVTPVPTAAVMATKAAPAKVKPTGTINYGVKETGILAEKVLTGCHSFGVQNQFHGVLISGHPMVFGVFAARRDSDLSHVKEAYEALIERLIDFETDLLLHLTHSNPCFLPFDFIFLLHFLQVGLTNK